MQYDFQCSCGDRWYGDVPRKTLMALKLLWRKSHTGDDHRTVETRMAPAIERAEEAGLKCLAAGPDGGLNGDLDGHEGQ